MSSFSRLLAGAVFAMLGVAVLTGAAAGAAQADTAAVDSLPPGTSTAISGPGGKATVTGGDWFGFVVYLDPNLPNWDTSNKWHQSTEAYTRPDGLVYRTYRHTGTGDCLSHMPVNDADGLLITEPCVWSDNSQWWAVDHVLFQAVPCPPGSWPFCPPDKYVDILIPWDAPERAATVQDGVLELHPRGGAVGTAAQRLSVKPFPKQPH